MTIEYPDLAPARVALTSLMIDDFTVTRDPQGTDDDTFDYNNPDITPPAGDTTTVYDGKGKIRPAGTQGNSQSEGDRTFEATDYLFSVPITADYAPRIGDLITCVGAVRDSSLVGKQWRVEEPLASTFSVSRKARCQLRQTPDGAQ